MNKKERQYILRLIKLINQEVLNHSVRTKLEAIECLVLRDEIINSEELFKSQNKFNRRGGASLRE